MDGVAWQEADLQYLKDVIAQEAQTLKNAQLLQQLAQALQVSLKQRAPRQVLKK